MEALCGEEDLAGGLFIIRVNSYEDSGASRLSGEEDLAEASLLTVNGAGQIVRCLRDLSEGKNRRHAIVRVLGGDTECPLQVCRLSRSSEGTHFLSVGRDVAFY